MCDMLMFAKCKRSAQRMLEHILPFIEGRLKLKEITSRSNALGYERLKLKLKQFIMGWVNYFRLADMNKLLISTDKWLRRRLRMYIWKRWKRIRTRYTMLKRLGLNRSNAEKYANTRKGYWHIAKSQILSCTITDNRLRQAGYTFFADYYKTVKV